jgi:hypothetical protein
MKGRLIGAALTLSLVFIPPAFAQVADVPAAPRAKAPIAEQMEGSASEVRREIGYQNANDTIIRSLPLSDKASLDIGIFSVARHSHKAPNLRRYEMMKEVHGNSQHIPAVSFSLRF